MTKPIDSNEISIHMGPADIYFHIPKSTIECSPGTFDKLFKAGSEVVITVKKGTRDDLFISISAENKT